MSPEDYDLIEKNLLGTAAPSEQAALQSRLQEPAFRQAYDEVAHIAQDLKIHERKRLHDLLKEIEQRQPGSFPYLAIAASVVLLLTFGWFLWFAGNNHGDLFDRYYEPYAALKFQRPRGAADLYKAKVQAYKYYRAGDDDAAVALLDSVLLNHPDDEEVRFVIGLSHLEAKNFPDAIAALEGINRFPEARWYLALALLGEGLTDVAQTTLEEIATDDTAPNQEAAIRLLKDLNE